MSSKAFRMISARRGFIARSQSLLPEKGLKQLQELVKAVS